MSETKTFVLPADREQVTLEPQLPGKWTPRFPEMTALANQGGGKVPADFTWRSSPKQWQEELTDAQLRNRHVDGPELPNTNRPR